VGHVIEFRTADREPRPASGCFLARDPQQPLMQPRQRGFPPMAGLGECLEPLG
jgi:hypothetical protein